MPRYDNTHIHTIDDNTHTIKKYNKINSKYTFVTKINTSKNIFTIMNNLKKWKDLLSFQDIITQS